MPDSVGGLLPEEQRAIKNYCDSHAHEDFNVLAYRLSGIVGVTITTSELREFYALCVI